MKMKLPIILLSSLAGMALCRMRKSESGISIKEVENSIEDDGEYGIMVQNGKHFKAAVTIGTKLVDKHSDIQWHVVLIAEAVKDLADDDALQEVAEEADKAGLRVIACQSAMDKLGVKKSDLPDTVEITENGVIYMLGLQENDFKTLSL